MTAAQPDAIRLCGAVVAHLRRFTMKTMKSITMLGVCACAVAFTTQAHAKTNLVYTYDSAPLNWQWATLYGVDDDTFGSFVTPIVSFSFTAPTSWLSLTTPTTFTIPKINAVQVDFDLPYHDYFVDPGSGGTITVGAGGAILGWDFDVGGHVGKWDIQDPKLLISSAFGVGCNCDTLNYSTNITYSPHDGPPIILGRGVAFYSGASNINGWQYAMVSSVPEVPEYLMMASGLGLIGWLARRRRTADGQSRLLALPA
jgi:hypothetical protein